MARRAPKSLRPTVASAAGLLAVALVAVLLLPLGTTVSSTVHAQSHVPQGPASATEPRTGSVAPPATAHRGSTRELPDSAPVNPSAGSLFRTVFPNYNTTTSFNFPGTVWDWQVGTPAFIPSTNSLWLPTRAVPAVGGPLPLIAPVVVYSETLETFTGVVPSIQNSSALLYDPSNGLVYSAESFNNTVVAVSASSGGWVQTFPVGTDPTALALDPHSSLLYVANTGSTTGVTGLTAINCSTSMIWNSSITTGPSPRALAFDPFSQLVFVADGGDPDVWDVNATTNLSSTYTAVYPNPVGLAFSTSGSWLAVTSSSGTRMTFLNTSGKLPISTTINLGTTGAGPVEVNGTGPDFVIGISTGSSIVEVNATSATVVASGIPVGTDVTQLAPDPANLGVIAWGAADRNLTVVNLISEKPVMSSSTLGPEPASIAYDPGTNRMFVVNAFGGRVMVLDATTDLTVSKGWWFGAPALSVAVDPSTGYLYVGTSSGIDAVDPADGAVLYSVPLAGNNTPLLVDTVDGLLWDDNAIYGLTSLSLDNLVVDHVVHIPAGQLIQQDTMALVPPLDELFVINETAHDVEAVDATTGGIVLPPIDAGSEAQTLAYDAADGDLYVVGANVTIIDPATGLLVGPPIVLVPHAISTGIAYDPTREDLYITSSLGKNYTYIGTLSVLDGSSVSASYDSQVVTSIGELPTDPVPVVMPGTVSPATSVVWVANLFSGTLSEFTTAPEITFFSASPNPIDLGQTSQLLLGYLGGTGPDQVGYSGLPTGCSSANTPSLDCTPTVAGTFTITADVVDAFGFSATSSTQLTVASSLSVQTTFTPTSIASLDVGQSFTASATAIGGTPEYSYQWNFGDGTSSTVASVTHAYESTGRYLLNLTVTDAARATATASTVVQVVALPTTVISVTPTTSTDVYLPLQFSASISGGTLPGAAIWTFGDGTIISETGVVGESTVSHAFTLNGTYLVKFEYVDASGNYGNQTQTVVVHSPLAASFSAGVAGSSVPPTVGQSVPFVANVSGGLKPYSVTWHFDDGSLAVGMSVQHSYAAAGHYLINVTLVDAAGAEVNESLPLTVAAAPTTTSTSTSSSSGNLYLGLFLGILIGATVALIVLYLAGRSRRRPPVSPSPYVPPADVSAPSWKED